MKIKIAYSLGILAISFFIVSMLIFLINSEFDIFFFLSRSLNIGLVLSIFIWLLLIAHFYQNKKMRTKKFWTKKVKISLTLSLLIVPTFMISTISANKLNDYYWKINHPNLNVSASCDEAYKLAVIHEQNDNLGMVLGGLTFPEEYAKILRKKYKIKTYFGSCLYTAGRGCYYEYMEEAIKKKYGENCFKIALKELERLKEKNTVSSLGDREALD